MKTLHDGGLDVKLIATLAETGVMMGRSPSGIYRIAKTDPTFPRPIALSPGRIGFLVAELEAYVAALPRVQAATRRTSAATAARQAKRAAAKQDPVAAQPDPMNPTGAVGRHEAEAPNEVLEGTR
jgi:predicted DNA-binding transcriptional regulator AlpA